MLIYTCQETNRLAALLSTPPNLSAGRFVNRILRPEHLNKHPAVRIQRLWFPPLISSKKTARHSAGRFLVIVSSYAAAELRQEGCRYRLEQGRDTDPG